MPHHNVYNFPFSFVQVNVYNPSLSDLREWKSDSIMMFLDIFLFIFSKEYINNISNKFGRMKGKTGLIFGKQNFNYS